MKVLHIITTLDKGGAENCLYKIVLNLKTCEHIVICLNRNGYFFKKFQSYGIETYCVNLWPKNIFYSSLKLFYLIKKIKPDLIHTWLYHSDLIGGLIGRFAGVKNIIWSLRNTEVPQKGISSIFLIIKACSFLSYFVPNKIVCCGNSVKKKHEIIGYKRDKLVVINNGFSDPYKDLDISIRDKVRNQLSINKNDFVIGLVGRFDYLKAYDFFIKSVSLLSKRNLKRKVIVIFAGKNLLPSNKILMQWINKCSPKIEFKLLGERDDIPLILKSLDLFCLNSRAEGFPNVLSEAMLAALPCIATNVGDVKKILGNNGLIIPNDNPEYYAEAIYSFYKMQKNKLNNYGKLGRNRILKIYSLEKMLNSYDKLYGKFR